MLILGGLLTVATICFCCFLLVSLMAHERIITDISFAETERIELIELDLGAGGIELIGRSGDAIVSGQRIVDRGLAKPTFSEEIIGNTLRLTAKCPDFAGFNCGSRYVLSVPADIDISGSSSGGSITITGVTGALTLHSSGGDITIGDPIGPLQLSTSGGGISVTGGRSAEVVASSTSSGVSLEFLQSPTTVDAETSSGAVTVVLPADGSAFAIDASADSGEPEVGVSTDPRSERTIRAHSSSGDVTIRYLESGS